MTGRGMARDSEVFLENHSTGPDYKSLLRSLPEDELEKLAALNKNEMELLGYKFNVTSLQFAYED